MQTPHKPHTPEPEVPLNAARGQNPIDLRPVPPDGDAKPTAQPPEEDAFLHRTMPGRQRFAKAFLAGKSPGLQQRYAPNAATSDVEGWVEDEETVERLLHWRKEAPYG